MRQLFFSAIYTLFDIGQDGINRLAHLFFKIFLIFIRLVPAVNRERIDSAAARCVNQSFFKNTQSVCIAQGVAENYQLIVIVIFNALKERLNKNILLGKTPVPVPRSGTLCPEVQRPLFIILS